MGYMGLENYVDSDEASGLMGMCIDAIVPVLKKELKVVNNEYNTDGCVNVALFFEAVVIPAEMGTYEEGLAEVAQETITLIQEKLDTQFENPDDWSSKDNYDEHKDAYERMIEALIKWLEGD
tara:strand:+ start:250 stop:615 length:366 start_codon:yes stop_codon:yes gene_type:complete